MKSFLPMLYGIMASFFFFIFFHHEPVYGAVRRILGMERFASFSIHVSYPIVDCLE
ncbi:hypothetical protein QFZ78_006581 [Paenibacillus sp. V4I5]|nr:hypothetical protein [Paenibacillus sp. V4I5]